MTQVEIKVQIDAQDPKQVEALNTFLSIIGGSEAPAKSAPKKTTVSKPKKEEPAKETPKAEPAKEELTQEQESSEVSIEDVRALLSKKVKTHRTEVKGKLTELGANNVTSMDPSKYQEFMDFLNGLK